MYYVPYSFTDTYIVTLGSGILPLAGVCLGMQAVREGKATGSKLIYSRGSITFSSGGFLQFCVRISIEPYHSSTEKILA